MILLFRLAWILLTVVLIEMFLRPRLDRTRNGALLLFYGTRTRRYIVLQHRQR